MKWSALLPVCLTLVLTAGAAQAQEDKPAGGAMKAGKHDDAVYATLKEVINHGANLYNTGDWNGCYRLWEGALMTAKPMLAHKPELQKAIDNGIANARQDPLLYRRAWVLRSVLDQIRADIKGETPGGKDKTPVVTPDKSKPKTLWARLGGEQGVTKIVDDLANAAVADPKVDFFRHNKFKLEPGQVAKMKRELVEQVSQLTGGPLKYNGPDMKKVHKGMGITNEQFNALAGHLKAALEKNKVAPDDVDTVLAAVNTYRDEIVEPKKPEDKKPEDKKPTDKKPEDKKPADKKPEDKKPVDKKPEDKKPTDKKPEDKKPAAAANLTGKVTFKGQPAAGVKIGLVAADGKAVSATVAEDGSYQLAVKPGEYGVTVSGTAKLALPAAYADAKTTPLKLTVAAGKQIHDIELK
jgi:truncated hemoglobin YjbI